MERSSGNASAYTRAYAGSFAGEPESCSAKPRLFMNNRSQAVRLQKISSSPAPKSSSAGKGRTSSSPLAQRTGRLTSTPAPSRQKSSWEASRTCPYRNATSDAGLHARYGYLLVHHEALRPRRPHQAQIRRSQRPVCISVITKAELLYGVALSPRQTQDQAAVDAYLRHVEVLNFPDAAAPHYADIRAALKTSGAMIGANDLLIAAHARVARANTRHQQCSRVHTRTRLDGRKLDRTQPVAEARPGIQHALCRIHVKYTSPVPRRRLSS